MNGILMSHHRCHSLPPDCSNRENQTLPFLLSASCAPGWPQYSLGRRDTVILKCHLAGEDTSSQGLQSRNSVHLLQCALCAQWVWRPGLVLQWVHSALGARRHIIQEDFTEYLKFWWEWTKLVSRQKLDLDAWLQWISFLFVWMFYNLVKRALSQNVRYDSFILSRLRILFPENFTPEAKSSTSKINALIIKLKFIRQISFC